jgi:hypothetical protein
MKQVPDYSADWRYYEEVPIHTIAQYLLFGGLGLIAFLTTVVPRGAPKYILSMGIALIVFAGMTFRILKVAISDTHLTVSYGPIKHVLSIDNIESVQAPKAPWYMYGGLGIRFGWDWSVGYIQNWRRGVRVVPKKGRVLYFSSNNPDEIERILLNLKKGHTTA